MVKKASRSKNELLPGTLEMLILKTLTRGMMHGYGIAQFIKQTSEGVLEIEEGSLYPALQRLQLKGWVVSHWAQSPHNRRARYYRLTPAGRKQGEQEVSDLEQMLAGIFRVLKPA